MTFRVGEDVICVDDANQGGDAPFAVKGAVYKITDMDSSHPLGLGLNFAELGMSPDDFLFAWRFRPLAKNKPDLSSLKALLVPGAKIKEEA